MTTQGSSPASAIVPIAIFGGFALLIFLLRRRDVTRIRDGFRLAGASDAKIHFWGGQIVSGHPYGESMRVELYQGKNSSHTDFHLALPTAMPPFEMHLSAQNRFDTSLQNRGLEIDVQVGDPAFDPNVVVEAAPADLARAVLGPILREKILARMPCYIHVTGGEVVVRVDRKITSPSEIADLLSFTRLVSDHVKRGPQELAAQQVQAAQQASAQGYRGADASAVRAAMEGSNGFVELARLRNVRRARETRFRALIGVFTVGSFGLWLAFVFFKVRPQNNATTTTHTSTTSSTSKSSTSHTKPSAGPSSANLALAVSAVKAVSQPSPVTHTTPKKLEPKLPTGPITHVSFCALEAGIDSVARRSLCTASEQAKKSKMIDDADQTTAQCITSLEQSIHEQRTELDTNAARECVQSTYARWNGRGTADIRKLEEAENKACANVLKGKGKVDASCRGDIECENGLVCAGDAATAKCKQPSKNGASCGIAIDGTTPLQWHPQFLGDDVHRECESGLTCEIITSVCQPLAAEGAKCDLFTPCVDDLHCVGGVCSTTQRGAGDACSTSGLEDCKSGLHCDGATLKCAPNIPFAGLCD